MTGSRKKLANTLTVWIALPITLGFGLFLALNINREVRSGRRQAERECEDWSSAVAIGLRQAVAMARVDPHTAAAALIANQQAANPMMGLRFIDQNGRDLVVGPTMSPSPRPVELVQLRNAVTHGRPVSYYEVDGRWLTHLQPVDDPRGVLLVSMTMDEELSRIRQNAVITALAGILTMILVAVAVRLLIGRLVVRPVSDVLQAVEQIGRGNLSARVPDSSENEIGVLADHVNRMAALRQEQETALRASEERYRQTIDQAVDALFMVDPKTDRIVDVNQAAEWLTGYERHELRRMTVWDLQADAGKSDRRLWEQVRTGEVALSQEVAHRRKNREPFVASVRVGLVRYGNQEVIQRVVRDLTGQKELEQERHHLELELLQQAKLSAIGALLQGVVHNLRSPLTGILGFAQVLRNSHSEMSKLDWIISESKRMNAILENLLLKSRREQDRERTSLNLNELLKEELQFLEADLDFKHRVEKIYSFSPDLPQIEGAYGDFSQGLMNVVRNAVDAMHDSPQKRLTVTTRSDEDFVYVDIGDTGCGIPPEHLPRIFQPFFTTKPRMGTQHLNEPTGTGLGLSSCLQLLKPYDVDIDVNSKLDAGTTFTVRIPQEA